jgi:hypothetical protein
MSAMAEGLPRELLWAGRWLCVAWGRSRWFDRLKPVFLSGLARANRQGDYFAPNLYAVFFGSKSASVKPLLVFTFM